MVDVVRSLVHTHGNCVAGVEFRKLYAEKLAQNEPWWETDYTTPRRRYYGAWATMPPSTSPQEIRALIRNLDGLCDVPVSDAHLHHTGAGNGNDSEDTEVDREQEGRNLMAELAASLATVEGDPAAHRLLRRQSEDPCIVAHAIAEELAVVLARERAETFALSVSKPGTNTQRACRDVPVAK